ncbi:RING finger protein nhl-1 like protein [Argiope bruennichi]|uniref:RING finger protein nhl-1 like protein n=1 Tax=Argiope bruennichi TaxID=94029 RepID=A0A8T0FY45_ARGBR|nr:RING finger protein nhl-1 like protein [Argiope bruennichi]
MSGPWFRMDQLLKCSVCSDRFRNPKLLPCNHTFCAEPCLSRCIEKGKGSVKCPECSSEHRLPIKGGVQGFPHNVTLGRFLELRQQVSGVEPDLPASMQRCNTCKEKGQLEMCAHCNRKVCKECKAAHVKILRKEIALINEQVREGLQQLSKSLHDTEENADKLQKNYSQVKDEIEEVIRRYTRDLLSTEAKLKHHLDVYLKTELRSMKKLEHDLQIELNNVNSNCDLVDKYVNNGVDWTDAELTDYKEIFMKTLDFLRAFDSDPTDCVRKVKFHPRSDPDVIHKTLIDFAEVKLNDEVIHNPVPNGETQNGGMYNSSTNVNGPTVTLTPPQGSALSRSQSDHKLCNQRQSQKRKDKNEEIEPLSRRFRDRFVKDKESSERDNSNNRDHSPSSWRRELDDVRSSQKIRFASREAIDEIGDYEVENTSSRNHQSLSPVRDGVSETEDATKGPLSGVIKILDSPHVMERLHHSEVKQKKQREEEERKAKMPKPAPPPVSRPMTRQLSEDEIEKQKKANKAAAAASAATNTASNTATAKATSGTETSTKTSKPSILKKDDEPTSRSYSSRYGSTRSSVDDTSTPKPRNRTSIEEPAGRQSPREETQTPPPRIRSWRTTSSAATERDVSLSPPSSPTRNRDTQKPPVSPRPPPSSNRPAGRSYLTKNSSLDREDSPTETTKSPSLMQRRSNLSSAGRPSALDRKDDRPSLRLAIRPDHNSPPISDSSSSSDSESDEVDSETAVNRGDISPSVNTLLARSAQARKQSASTQARLLGRPDDKLPRPGTRSWRDNIRKDDELSRDKDSISSSRRKTATVAEPEGRVSPYSRFLERRRSSVNSGAQTRDKSPEDNSYAARKNRIARSKSSHDLYPADDSPEDDVLTAIRNRYRARRNREASPEETPPHSWSQYMKNKYGSGLVRSRTSASLAVPKSDSENSSDEDTPPRRREYGRRGDSSSPRGFSLPRRTYMQKGKSCIKFGSRGADVGQFTWPRGVTVGTDNTIVVADSNNHRVQVFTSNGKFIQQFGSYGSSEGEFDCLAGVTVNRIGQFIVSDRYNHRLQVFDPNGRFIRAFGCEGRMDGKFSYPWGVATDNLGFIYVCDKENHRIQVFQGDGTFVTKFGGIGQRPGELEHPHYVAVSTTNRVIVSDSNNHRIQIFDVNGRLLSTFGTEGSEEGQFKYPRGVAVDDQGYLIVGDSGNNRIQIFHPDGTFLKAFGTWGSGDGEFKGLEGVAVSPTGQILACDRENHRIQVF